MQRLLDASVEAVPTKPRPVNFGRIAGRWETLRRSGNAEPLPAGEDPAAGDANVARWQAADAALEFGRFRVFLRQRQLVADGVPVKLGTRTFDLLLALLETDGSLVTKDKLLTRVWSGFVVCEENLKVQIKLLRQALGDDRDLIRTEFGRGYPFTGVVHAAATGRLSALDAERRDKSTIASAMGVLAAAACRVGLRTVLFARRRGAYSGPSRRLIHRSRSRS